MKIKYFSYMAEQAFTNSPNGERLFLHGMPWSRGYIVPDAETEKRLYKKLVWVLRIYLGFLILSLPFLLIMFPQIFDVPLWFMLYFLTVVVTGWVADSLVFRKELLSMSRANSQSPLYDYYRDFALRHSLLFLLYLFFGSICSVAIGSQIIRNESNPLSGWFVIIFFGFSAIASSYALYLKMKLPKKTELPENEKEA